MAGLTGVFFDTSVLIAGSIDFGGATGGVSDFHRRRGHDGRQDLQCAHRRDRAAGWRKARGHREPPPEPFQARLCHRRLGLPREPQEVTVRRTGPYNNCTFFR